MDHPTQVVYQNVVYYRNPGSTDRSKRVYYQSARASYLHRDIYEDSHGPIPKGMQVHHVDHDPFNNNPLNLMLLSPSEHRHAHAEKFDEERMKIFRETTLKAAAEWHRSEEGRAWHREHGRQTWEGRQPDGQYTCPECGKEHEGFFASRGTPTTDRYCSSACRQRGDRRNGKYETYMEDAECLFCGAFFKRWRTKGVQTCSRSCGAKLRWSRAKS